MKVRDAMRRSTLSCRPDESLASAAAKMWERDTGVVPVVDEKGSVVGMITDRDIAIGCGTRDRPAARIAVSEVMAPNVESCHEDDDLRTAIERMRERKVLRLPVVDSEGMLQGILSMHDVPLFASDQSPAISYEEVIGLFQSFAEHRRNRPHPVH